MKHFGSVIAASMVLSAAVTCPAQRASAQTPSDLMRETLRQQSAAELSSCPGIQRTLARGTDAMLVVRTAVELGYNPCQVIRCSLEDATTPEKKLLCDKVVRGAVAAGVKPDVISRCSAEVCDPAVVAAVLSSTLLEPNYCYFSSQEPGPAPLPPSEPTIGRDVPRPQASPFTF